MLESVKLQPASFRCADPQRRRGQVVVLPSHQQRGKRWRAVSSSPSSRRHRSTASSLLLAESGDAAMRHHLHPMQRLRVPFVNRRCGVKEMRVESAVSHGAVKAANGPYADWERFSLRGPPPGVALGGSRSAESFRIRFVEPPSLPTPHSLSIHYNSCCIWRTEKYNSFFKNMYASMVVDIVLLECVRDFLEACFFFSLQV